MKRFATFCLSGLLVASASSVSLADGYLGHRNFFGPQPGCAVPNLSYYPRSAYRPFYPPIYGSGYPYSFYGSQPLGVGVGLGGFGNAPFPPYGAYGIGSPYHRNQPGVSLYFGR